MKTAPELETMRRCGRAVAEALKAMGEAARPDAQTQELNEIGESVLASHGAAPSFKGYRGFPAAVCISVNEEVVHGIPGDRPLREGDIVGLDIGAQIDGLNGDGAWTFQVGEVSREVRRLLNVTEESLYQGIAQARTGRRIGDISHAVQSYVERNGYSVVRDLVGHGIGRGLHEDPSVPNFGRPGTGARLRPGMTICIEPMINQSKAGVRVLKDRWTVVTRDRRVSAHFEHMVCVTDGAPEIMTALDISRGGYGQTQAETEN